MRVATKFVRALAVVALLQVAAGSAALAAPVVEISVAQRKQVVEEKAGAPSVKWVPAQEVQPGDVLEYVLTYANKGDAVARDAVIDDPIPSGTTYVANSAAGDGAEVTFSSDGGRTYAAALKLTYEVKLPNGLVEKRIATPSDYTHVRFTIASVAPGASGAVSFKVKVH